MKHKITRQHRLNELRNQRLILLTITSTDECPTIVLEQIKPYGRQYERFKRMAAKLTKKRIAKLLADTEMIELLLSRSKAASGD
jgi:hypothetical protein